eukprot:231147_1
MLQNIIKYESVNSPRLHQNQFPKDFNGVSLNNLDFDVDDVIDSAKIIYEKQCDLAFGKKFMTDEGYAWCLTVGIKNNFPFLQYLVDIYIKHSLMNKKKTRTFNEYSYHQWLERIGFTNILKT